MKETILWLALAVAVIVILWKLTKHKWSDSSISWTEPNPLRRSFSTPVEPLTKPVAETKVTDPGPEKPH